MEGYLGTTVAGFPNFFTLIGPNTGLGHNSMVVMMEAQFSYVLSAVGVALVCRHAAEDFKFRNAARIASLARHEGHFAG